MFDLLKNEEYDESTIYFGDEEVDEKRNENENTSVNNLIQSKIKNYSNGMEIESLLGSLVKGRIVIPDFQRRFVWNKEQVAKLALSIIKSVPVPPIYMYVNENKKKVILDGQQRVTAMFLYFNNLWYVGTSAYNRFDYKEINRLNHLVMDLEKSNGEKTSEENSQKIEQIYDELEQKHGVVRETYSVDEDKDKNLDITFSSFEEDEQDYILSTRIDYTLVECVDKNPSRVYAEIFKLLNSGGRLLGTQEIRNGIYWETELYKKLFEINRNAIWRKVYGKESLYSKDVEILLKMLAIDYYTKEESGVISIDFGGTFKWASTMDEYSELSRQWNKAMTMEETDKLIRFLNAIDNLDAVKKKCNKAIFEAIFVAFCKINRDFSIDYEWMCSLDKEEEFQKGNVLSNKDSVQKRLTKALILLGEKYNV